MTIGDESPITELYTLTHPFFLINPDHHPDGLYNPQKYQSLWQTGLKDAAHRDGTFLILSRADRRSVVGYLEDELIDMALELFDETNRLILENGQPSYDERVARRSNESTLVSGRGLFAIQCVRAGVKKTAEHYNIPFENASIDFLASLDVLRSKEDYKFGVCPDREKFPNIEEREMKRAELGKVPYEQWISQLVAKFERIFYANWHVRDPFYIGWE